MSKCSGKCKTERETNSDWAKAEAILVGRLDRSKANLAAAREEIATLESVVDELFEQNRSMRHLLMLYRDRHGATAESASKKVPLDPPWDSPANGFDS